MADLLLMLAVFAAIFIAGYLLIRRIPQMLHTPLMSMTNALSAVTMLGAFLLFAVRTSILEKIIAGFAIAAALFNVAGGFIITDRMLRMFRRKSGEHIPAEPADIRVGPAQAPTQSTDAHA